MLSYTEVENYETRAYVRHSQFTRSSATAEKARI